MREARCHCGQLRVQTEGDALRVTQCHCEECQRRTGSAFNLGVVFDASQITIVGDYSTYHRQGEQGLDIEFHFCPDCGSNVHWLYNGIHVVAGGCFADPEFARPTVSLYGRDRHRWLPPVAGITGYVTHSNGPLEDGPG